jgi:hypothetical protein
MSKVELTETCRQARSHCDGGTESTVRRAGDSGDRERAAGAIGVTSGAGPAGGTMIGACGRLHRVASVTYGRAGGAQAA